MNLANFLRKVAPLTTGQDFVNLTMIASSLDRIKTADDLRLFCQQAEIPWPDRLNEATTRSLAGVAPSQVQSQTDRSSFEPEMTLAEQGPKNGGSQA